MLSRVRRFARRTFSFLSTKKGASGALYALGIVFFLFFVFFPAVYVLLLSPGIRLDSEVLGALSTSFQIAFLSTFISILFGIPLAWTIFRSKGVWKDALNSLVDMPLIVPTSALGFSVYLFYGTQHGIGILDKGFWMLVALHTVFVFPYIVRTVFAAFEELDSVYETAARSLGAGIITVFRTISIPLVKSSIIIGAVLSFTRSLSETGATMMAAGLVRTASVQVLDFKTAGDISGAASVSVALIVSAICFLLLAKFLARKASFSIEGFFSPRLESKLGMFHNHKTAVVILFFLIFILLPAFFLFVYLLGVRQIPSGDSLSLLLGSLAVSFGIAFAVTIVNLFFGSVLALLIGRNKFGLGKLFESLNDVVLIVPTSALGFSLGLYWSGIQLPEIIVIALAHLSFTFPYLVTPIAASVAQLDRNIEEAASTLGATPYKIFRTITLPLIFPSVLAGIIMAFMRSMSETGATLAVSKTISTVPVLIVNLVKSNSFSEAAFACAVLFTVSFILLLVMRGGVKRA